MLLYVGGVVAGVAALLAIIFFLVSRLRRTKLNAQLDKEYGEV